jgi:serine/threonine protein phosphatase PrpC
VLPDPWVHTERLCSQDRFLILGSDGLWDEMGSQQAVQLVGEHLSGVHLQVFICCQSLALFSS